MPRLFVYGTLKRGLSNASRLEGAIFEGVRSTANGYALHRVAGFPALVRSGDGIVRGEVYTVSDEHLRRLDAFEDSPNWYQREIIRLDDGCEADAYLMSREAVGDAPPIQGDEYIEERR